MDETRTTDWQLTRTDWIWVTGAFIAYVLHALLFRGWIIDDAGISFAYARNLAFGHGLVSQPGVVPVEGYSNPSWVFLTALFWRLGVFHPYVTPKLVSALLVLASYWVLARTMRSILHAGRGVIVAVLLLLSVNTSFVVWTTSGMENALYVFLAVLLNHGALATAVQGGGRASRAAALGGVAFLIAITRPDGGLLALLYPAVLMLDRITPRPGRVSRPAGMGISLAVFLGAFLVFLAGFLFFRRIYFHDLLPNTYYVKGGNLLFNLKALLLLRPDAIGRVQALGQSVAGPLAVPLVGLLAAAAVHLWFARGFTRAHALALVGVLLTAGVYVLLPNDWMGEYRFATPFFPLFYGWALMLLAASSGRLPLRRQALRPLQAALLLVAVGGGLVLFAGRTRAYTREPDVPLAWIKYNYSDRFDGYAERLGIHQGSLMLSPLGASLFYSHLRIYDLAGLCDRTVARTVYFDRTRDLQAFHDYVFEKARPTFILTRQYFTSQTRLYEDERLARDYLPLLEYVDPWVERHRGKRVTSGAYLRRDVPVDPEQLARIQEELARTPLVFARER
jgi:hypothetical protein